MVKDVEMNSALSSGAISILQIDARDWYMAEIHWSYFSQRRQHQLLDGRVF